MPTLQVGSNDLATWSAIRDDASAAGYDVIVFYHWSPSKLLSTLDPNRMVQLPIEDDRFCDAGDSAWSAEQARWCIQTPDVLQKIYSPKLREVRLSHSLPASPRSRLRCADFGCGLEAR